LVNFSNLSVSGNLGSPDKEEWGGFITSNITTGIKTKSWSIYSLIAAVVREREPACY
jgi:hypothetical protein